MLAKGSVLAFALVVAGGAILLTAIAMSAGHVDSPSRAEAVAPVATATATAEHEPVVSPTAEAPLPPAAPVETLTETPPVAPEEPPSAPTRSVPAPTATTAPRQSPVALAPTATAVPPPAPPQAPVATVVPPPPPASVALTGLEQEMYASHNAQRAAAGVASLSLDATLVAVARERAADMAAKGYFAHTSPSGETAFTILKRVGFAYSIHGENLARNNYPDGQTINAAMAGFLNSATHRANLLDAQFRLVGVGYALGGDGIKYFAVVFATR